MPRYGGGQEDFREQERRLAQMQERLTSIEAKEATAAAAADDLGVATEKATVRRRSLNRAKQEGAEITEREAAVAGREAAAIEVDTAAIERNRIARERRAAVARQERVNVQRALAGAQDPLFAQARALGPDVSQYRLRQQLAVGQGRAARLQEAAGAAFLTPGNAPGAVGALSRVQAAQVGLVASERELTQANRTLTNLKRRSSAVSEEEIAAALAQKQVAQESVNAAKLELQSAEQLAAARQEAAAATRVAAAREAEAGVVGGRGGALILHPTAATGVLTGREAVERGIQPGLEGARAAAASAAASHAKAAALQAEASSLGLVTDAERAYVASLSAESRQRISAAAAGSAVAKEQFATRVAANAGALRQEGVALGTTSQALHKHGALTQEFILATARGETTLRELGNQALVTAGKFGGWTAAATGLFAAAGAIREIGHGAIAAQGGVHTLQRVITTPFSSDSAHRAFGNLAREFNVPIETVIDAVYRMGQRFHSLPEAVEAARASLFSFKTGEVDVATSTENLLAIVNGFGLSSKELTSVYDQINQAQNTFGIRIRDTEAGLAKAAGTYRNSGGDLNYLLALTVAIGRATNRSGQEIGTGIARGVNQIRHSVNQARLESQGVDVIPDNFQKTLQNALKVAQKNPNADLQQIASGLFGNQYARLIAPVLRDQKVLNAALKDTSPESSKASAQRELAKVLKQADEQIHRIGISLQLLGAGLQQAGAFDIAGLFLHGLNDVLSVAVHLVEVFNHLPEPLRTALTVAGELAVAIKLLQRVGATERLAGTSLGFLANPDRQLGVRALSGLRGARDAGLDASEAAARRSYTLQNTAKKAELEAQRAVEAETKLVASSTVRTAETDAAIVAAQERVVAANAQHARLSEQAATAAQEAADARLIAAEADAEYIAAAKLSKAELAAQARAFRTPVPVETARPSTRGVEPYILPGTAGPGSEAARSLETQEAAAASQVGRNRQLTARAAAVEERLAQEWVPYGAGLANLGVVGRGANRAGQAAIAGAARATSAIESGVATVRGVGGSLAGFAAALGPLDVALGAFLVAPVIADQIDKHFAGYRTQLKDLQKHPRNYSQYQDRLAEARRATAGGGFNRQGAEIGAGAGAVALGGVALATGGLAIPAIGAGLLLGGIGGGLGFGGESDQDKAYRRAQKVLQADAELRLRQSQDRYAGRPVRDQFLVQITTSAKAQVDRATDGLESINKLNSDIDKHIDELRQSKYIKQPGQRRGRAQLEALRRSAISALTPSDFQARFGAAGADEVRAQESLTLTRLQQPGYRTSQFDLREIAAEYRYLDTAQRDAKSPQELKQVLDDRANYIQGLASVAQREQQEGHRATAHDILGSVTAGPQQELRAATSRLRTLRQRLHRQESEAAGLQDALRSTALEGLPVLLPHPTDLGPRLDAARSRVNATKRAIAAALRDLERLGLTAKQARAALDAITKESGFQAREDTRGRNLALVQSQTADPVQAATDEVNQTAKSLSDATKTFGKGSGHWKTAQANYNNALKGRSEAMKQAAEQDTQSQDEAAQTAEQIRSLTFQIAQARAHGDPVRIAEIARQAAQAAMAAAKKPVERLQATLDFVNATNDLEQAIRDRAQARFTYLESLTSDPLKQAHLETQAARAALGGTTGADRYRALADYNNKRRAEVQARVQGKEDDIQFGLDMERISTSTAISQYRALLKLHNLTKETRRDILRKIKSLQDSDNNSLDLNVGNIRLPTLYDVRRLAAQGTASAPRGLVQQSNQYTFHVRNDDDIQAIGGALGSIHGTDTRAALRAAGVS